MRKFFLITWLIVLSLLAALAWITWQGFITQPLSKQSESIVLVVPKGANAKQIANLLHQQGFLAKPQLFVWYLRYQEKQHLLKAGEFAIQPNFTVDELIDALIKGEAVRYEATIIAGHTFAQTLQQLHALPKLKKELSLEDIKGLQKAFTLSGEIADKYPYANLEGRFLPETYYFHAGDSDKTILLRAQQALNDVLQAAWEKRQADLPLKSPQEALVLASIVEKETGFAPERAEIAGVFVNRLRKKMRLQTDPTVIYGIGQDYDGNIRKKDLNAATAYNTYQMSGLPPTPIANPSREAIQAVLQPNQTKALYFVAKGGGQHIFSETLEAHNRAVQKYILNK
ncbi:endolytic murein transglycosylase [Thiosulfatimonas sediminis]|uniref:Endolytic murein transglycosylase n=1 Tax=Thiosulfatimonas sediminis TaxID=2675054 RepID=A0A6F8PWB2_9GAMM|nr:endolytic transglycosylase MltG [Thiosulfatimonas sediminis]BBP46260.1 endolytic murein transglycosylase [Thiosulfatimonas sediminis]